MQTLILLILLVNTALLLIILLRPRGDSAQKQLQELRRLLLLGPKKALVEDVGKIRSGDTREAVEGLIGKPDSLGQDAWIYLLDDHSGYRISFDTGGRVESVRTWVS